MNEKDFINEFHIFVMSKLQSSKSKNPQAQYKYQIVPNKNPGLDPVLKIEVDAGTGEQSDSAVIAKDLVDNLHSDPGIGKGWKWIEDNEKKTPKPSYTNFSPTAHVFFAQKDEIEAVMSKKITYKFEVSFQIYTGTYQSAQNNSESEYKKAITLLVEKLEGAMFFEDSYIATISNEEKEKLTRIMLFNQNNNNDLEALKKNFKEIVSAYLKYAHTLFQKYQDYKQAALDLHGINGFQIPALDKMILPSAEANSLTYENIPDLIAKIDSINDILMKEKQKFDALYQALLTKHQNEFELDAARVQSLVALTYKYCSPDQFDQYDLSEFKNYKTAAKVNSVVVKTLSSVKFYNLLHALQVRNRGIQRFQSALAKIVEGFYNKNKNAIDDCIKMGELLKIVMEKNFVQTDIDSIISMPCRNQIEEINKAYKNISENLEYICNPARSGFNQKDCDQKIEKLLAGKDLSELQEMLDIFQADKILHESFENLKTHYNKFVQNHGEEGKITASNVYNSIVFIKKLSKDSEIKSLKIINKTIRAEIKEIDGEENKKIIASVAHEGVRSKLFIAVEKKVKKLEEDLIELFKKPLQDKLTELNEYIKEVETFIALNPGLKGVRGLLGVGINLTPEYNKLNDEICSLKSSIRNETVFHNKETSLALTAIDISLVNIPLVNIKNVIKEKNCKQILQVFLSHAFEKTFKEKLTAIQNSPSLYFGNQLSQKITGILKLAADTHIGHDEIKQYREIAQKIIILSEIEKLYQEYMSYNIVSELLKDGLSLMNTPDLQSRIKLRGYYFEKIDPLFRKGADIFSFNIDDLKTISTNLDKLNNLMSEIRRNYFPPDLNKYSDEQRDIAYKKVSAYLLKKGDAFITTVSISQATRNHIAGLISNKSELFEPLQQNESPFDRLNSIKDLETSIVSAIKYDKKAEMEAVFKYSQKVAKFVLNSSLDGNDSDNLQSVVDGEESNKWKKISNIDDLNREYIKFTDNVETIKSKYLTNFYPKFFSVIKIVNQGDLNTFNEMGKALDKAPNNGWEIVKNLHNDCRVMKICYKNYNEVLKLVPLIKDFKLDLSQDNNNEADLTELITKASLLLQEISTNTKSLQNAYKNLMPSYKQYEYQNECLSNEGKELEKNLDSRITTLITAVKVANQSLPDRFKTYECKVKDIEISTLQALYNAAKDEQNNQKKKEILGNCQEFCDKQEKSLQNVLFCYLKVRLMEINDARTCIQKLYYQFQRNNNSNPFAQEFKNLQGRIESINNLLSLSTGQKILQKMSFAASDNDMSNYLYDVKISDEIPLNKLKEIFAEFQGENSLERALKSFYWKVNYHQYNVSVNLVVNPFAGKSRVLKEKDKAKEVENNQVKEPDDKSDEDINISNMTSPSGIQRVKQKLETLKAQLAECLQKKYKDETYCVLGDKENAFTMNEILNKFSRLHKVIHTYYSWINALELNYEMIANHYRMIQEIKAFFHPQQLNQCEFPDFIKNVVQMMNGVCTIFKTDLNLESNFDLEKKNQKLIHICMDYIDDSLKVNQYQTLDQYYAQVEVIAQTNLKQFNEIKNDPKFEQLKKQFPNLFEDALRPDENVITRATAIRANHDLQGVINEVTNERTSKLRAEQQQAYDEKMKVIEKEREAKREAKLEQQNEIKRELKLANDLIQLISQDINTSQYKYIKLDNKELKRIGKLRKTLCEALQIDLNFLKMASEELVEIKFDDRKTDFDVTHIGKLKEFRYELEQLFYNTLDNVIKIHTTAIDRILIMDGVINDDGMKIKEKVLQVKQSLSTFALPSLQLNSAIVHSRQAGLTIINKLTTIREQMLEFNASIEIFLFAKINRLIEKITDETEKKQEKGRLNAVIKIANTADSLSEKNKICYEFISELEKNFAEQEKKEKEKIQVETKKLELEEKNRLLEEENNYNTAKLEYDAVVGRLEIQLQIVRQELNNPNFKASDQLFVAKDYLDNEKIPKSVKAVDLSKRVQLIDFEEVNLKKALKDFEWLKEIEEIFPAAKYNQPVIDITSLSAAVKFIRATYDAEYSKLESEVNFIISFYEEKLKTLNDLQSKIQANCSEKYQHDSRLQNQFLADLPLLIQYCREKKELFSLDKTTFSNMSNTTFTQSKPLILKIKNEHVDAWKTNDQNLADQQSIASKFNKLISDANDYMAKYDAIKREEVSKLAKEEREKLEREEKEKKEKIEQEKKAIQDRLAAELKKAEADYENVLKKINDTIKSIQSVIGNHYYPYASISLADAFSKIETIEDKIQKYQTEKLNLENQIQEFNKQQKYLDTIKQFDAALDALENINEGNKTNIILPVQDGNSLAKYMNIVISANEKRINGRFKKIADELESSSKKLDVKKDQINTNVGKAAEFQQYVPEGEKAQRALGLKAASDLVVETSKIQTAAQTWIQTLKKSTFEASTTTLETFGLNKKSLEELKQIKSNIQDSKKSSTDSQIFVEKINAAVAFTESAIVSGEVDKITAEVKEKKQKLNDAVNGVHDNLPSLKVDDFQTAEEGKINLIREPEARKTALETYKNKLDQATVSVKENAEIYSKLQQVEKVVSTVDAQAKAAVPEKIITTPAQLEEAIKDKSDALRREKQELTSRVATLKAAYSQNPADARSSVSNAVAAENAKTLEMINKWEATLSTFDETHPQNWSSGAFKAIKATIDTEQKLRADKLDKEQKLRLEQEQKRQAQLTIEFDKAKAEYDAVHAKVNQKIADIKKDIPAVKLKPVIAIDVSTLEMVAKIEAYQNGVAVLQQDIVKLEEEEKNIQAIKKYDELLDGVENKIDGKDKAKIVLPDPFLEEGIDAVKAVVKINQQRIESRVKAMANKFESSSQKIEEKKGEIKQNIGKIQSLDQYIPPATQQSFASELKACSDFAVEAGNTQRAVNAWTEKFKTFSFTSQASAPEKLFDEKSIKQLKQVVKDVEEINTVSVASSSPSPRDVAKKPETIAEKINDAVVKTEKAVANLDFKKSQTEVNQEFQTLVTTAESVKEILPDLQVSDFQEIMKTRMAAASTAAEKKAVAEQLKLEIAAEKKIVVEEKNKLSQLNKLEESLASIADEPDSKPKAVVPPKPIRKPEELKQVVADKIKKAQEEKQAVSASIATFKATYIDPNPSKNENTATRQMVEEWERKAAVFDNAQPYEWDPKELASLKSDVMKQQKLRKETADKLQKARLEEEEKRLEKLQTDLRTARQEFGDVRGKFESKAKEVANLIPGFVMTAFQEFVFSADPAIAINQYKEQKAVAELATRKLEEQRLQIIEIKDVAEELDKISSADKKTAIIIPPHTQGLEGIEQVINVNQQTLQDRVTKMAQELEKSADEIEANKNQVSNNINTLQSLSKYADGKEQLTQKIEKLSHVVETAENIQKEVAATAEKLRTLSFTSQDKKQKLSVNALKGLKTVLEKAGSGSESEAEMESGESENTTAAKAIEKEIEKSTQLIEKLNTVKNTVELEVTSKKLHSLEAIILSEKVESESSEKIITPEQLQSVVAEKSKKFIQEKDKISAKIKKLKETYKEKRDDLKDNEEEFNKLTGAGISVENAQTPNFKVLLELKTKIKKIKKLEEQLSDFDSNSPQTWDGGAFNTLREEVSDESEKLVDTSEESTIHKAEKALLESNAYLIQANAKAEARKKAEEKAEKDKADAEKAETEKAAARAAFNNVLNAARTLVVNLNALLEVLRKSPYLSLVNPLEIKQIENNITALSNKVDNALMPNMSAKDYNTVTADITTLRSQLMLDENLTTLQDLEKKINTYTAVVDSLARFNETPKSLAVKNVSVKTLIEKVEAHTTEVKSTVENSEEEYRHKVRKVTKKLFSLNEKGQKCYATALTEGFYKKTEIDELNKLRKELCLPKNKAFNAQDIVDASKVAAKSSPLKSLENIKKSVDTYITKIEEINKIAEKRAEKKAAKKAAADAENARVLAQKQAEEVAKAETVQPVVQQPSVQTATVSPAASNAAPAVAAVVVPAAAQPIPRAPRFDAITAEEINTEVKNIENKKLISKKIELPALNTMININKKDLYEDLQRQLADDFKVMKTEYKNRTGFYSKLAPTWFSFLIPVPDYQIKNYMPFDKAPDALSRYRDAASVVETKVSKLRAYFEVLDLLEKHSRLKYFLEKNVVSKNIVDEAQTMLADATLDAAGMRSRIAKVEKYFEIITLLEASRSLEKVHLKENPKKNIKSVFAEEALRILQDKTLDVSQLDALKTKVETQASKAANILQSNKEQKQNNKIQAGRAALDAKLQKQQDDEKARLEEEKNTKEAAAKAATEKAPAEMLKELVKARLALTGLTPQLKNDLVKYGFIQKTELSNDMTDLLIQRGLITKDQLVDKVVLKEKVTELQKSGSKMDEKTFLDKKSVNDLVKLAVMEKVEEHDPINLEHYNFTESKIQNRLQNKIDWNLKILKVLTDAFSDNNFCTTLKGVDNIHGLQVVITQKPLQLLNRKSDPALVTFKADGLFITVMKPHVIVQESDLSSHSFALTKTVNQLLEAARKEPQGTQKMIAANGGSLKRGFEPGYRLQTKRHHAYIEDSTRIQGRKQTVKEEQKQYTAHEKAKAAQLKRKQEQEQKLAQQRQAALADPQRKKR